MTNKELRRAMNAYVGALVGCSTQLMTILDHMARYPHSARDAPPPPVVLANLLEDTLRHTRSVHPQDLRAATAALLATAETIEREIYMVGDDCADDEFDDFVDDDFPGPPASNGSDRLH